MIQAAKVNALRAVHLQHTSCASCAECPHLLVSRGWLSGILVFAASTGRTVAHLHP